MLLKAAGDYRLARLRTICLFDAEFNMNNDRTSKAGLAAALDLGEIDDEQYSRPCRSAIDHVVNRRLTFDYFAYCKKAFGICSCDLAGCYDRIVHAAASLALQRLGVPLSRIKGMFDTIQRLIKKVRTAYGDSDETYGGDDVEYPYLLPPQGVYQGNCNGPPVWSIISSTVFSVLRKEGYGVHFITAISDEIYHLCGFAYVDDTDLIQEGGTAFEVAKDMQKALDLWADVMKATGQNLAPSKSWWYLVDFVWSRGTWKFNSDGERSDLIAFNTDGKSVSLKKLLHSEGTKMLGVYLAPDGNRKDELNYLITKAKDWADCIRVGHLGAIETRIALSTCIWKTILYPLPVTSFTDAEINKIIWPILEVALPRIGICRNLALALRYGPKRLGGLALINLLLDQGIQKVLYLLDHPWKGTPTGTLISANLQSLSLDCGIVGAVLDQSCEPLQWSTLKDTWIGYTWKFMRSRGITISNLDIPVLQLQRRRDCAIMLGIRSRLQDLTDSDMSKINICRLYLRAVTLSDITNAAGDRISNTVFQVKSTPPIPFFGHTYNWPSQPSPPTSFWSLWKDAITRAFCSNDSLELHDPLGDWIHDIQVSSPTWEWFCHFGNDGEAVGLYRVIKEQWFLHRRVAARSRRHMKFLPCGIPSSSAMDNTFLLRRVNVSVHHNGQIEIQSISLHRARFFRSPLQPDKVHLSFRDTFLQTMSTIKESSWLFRSFSFRGDLELLFQDFCNGNALVVSDGSYSEYRRLATASWVIESVDRTAKIRGDCVVPGLAAALNAYRAELAGILGSSATIYVLYLIALARSVQLVNWSDQVVGCDGYSALQKSLTKHYERVTCKHRHFDILAAIRGFWRHMPCEAFPVPIEAHKDDHFPYYALTRMEKMNVDMDKAAKLYLQSLSDRYDCSRYGPFHFGFPTLLHHGVPIQTEAYKSLMDGCVRNDLLQYWQSLWKLSSFEFSLIALDPLERAFASCSTTAHTFVMKWLSRQINLGTRASTSSLRRQGRLKFKCPRCHIWNDDMAHIYRCVKARSTIMLHLDSISEFLTSLNTDPDLVEGIRLCSNEWLKSSGSLPNVFLAHLPSHVSSALESQYLFGWLRFLNGIHLSCITNIQDLYFTRLRSHCSASKWHGQLIRELWKLADALYNERSDFLATLDKANDVDHPALPPARVAALAELRLGRGSIPVFYHQYFSISESSLLAKGPEDLRKWLYVVRLNREACHDPLLLTDEFSKDGTHRLWLTRL